jgi:AcrR family transcriptional regulator
MPRAPRSSEEIEHVKQRILQQALEIITEHGYDHLTMRRLGGRLGMAAKTIYNYYLNKDEIYLHVMKKGYDILYDDMQRRSNDQSDPVEKLRAMTRAFIDFGINYANYYDIMFTFYVPKYNDYIGTPTEPTAHDVLVKSLQCAELTISAIEEIGRRTGAFDQNQARLYFIKWFIWLHGLVALHNNKVLTYLHEAPIELTQTLPDDFLSQFFPFADKASP